MNKTLKAALVASVAAASALSLAACGGKSDAAGGSTVNIVGYSVLEQANANVIKAFQATDAGQDVQFQESYGASGDQSRAVLAGTKADEVHLSLEPDVAKLADAGIVDKNWKSNDTKGICTQSIVVMVVKSGNPKGIKTWADLTKPGVGIVTPNPASSGSAKWNLLAAYGSALAGGGSAADASSYMTSFFKNVVALPDSGRDATTAFTSGTGDVLLSYENEAILARQSGTDFDYVVPDSSILIQNPCAVTKDAPKAATDFMDFQKSTAGQKLYAETGYRPMGNVGSVSVDGANDPGNPFPTPAKLLNVDDDFGGWATANEKYFGSGTDGQSLGIITKLQSAAGQ